MNLLKNTILTWLHQFHEVQHPFLAVELFSKNFNVKNPTFFDMLVVVN